MIVAQNSGNNKRLRVRSKKVSAPLDRKNIYNSAALRGIFSGKEVSPCSEQSTTASSHRHFFGQETSVMHSPGK